MKKYGESIYATRGGPFLNGAWGGSTFKGKSIYLHILQWDDHQLVLPSLPRRIVRSTLLTGGAAVEVKQDAKQIVVTRRGGNYEESDAIIRLELNEPVEHMNPLALAPRKIPGNISITLAAGPDEPFVGHGAESLADGVRGTTDRKDGRWIGFLGKSSEAVIDFHEARTVRSVRVGCLQEQVSRIFYPTSVEVSCSDDGKNYREAGSIGNGQPRLDAEIRIHDFTVSFKSVTARFFKVRILNCGTCPPWHESTGKQAWILLDDVIIK